MPYKRKDKWVAQARKEGKRREKVFYTKKEALAWEAQMRRKPVDDWKETTDTTSLGDWAQRYLDYSGEKFSGKTYMEKRFVFKNFFQAVDPTLPVHQLTPAMVLDYIRTQKEERSGNAANKDRKNLITAWNWGIRYMAPQLPRPNPCQVEKMPEIRKPRYVPPEEDFWKAYDMAPTQQDRVMLLAFLHLAARRSEIFGLTVSDLDWEHQRVRLWTRKRQGGTQIGRAHV
jgi:integrase